MADTTASVPTEPVVDDNTETKTNIWQRWGRRQDWANELEKKATYRALDMPEDDTNITETKTTNTGAGGGTVAAAALAGGIPATLLAAVLGMSALRGPSQPAPQQSSPVASASADQKAHWDAGLYRQNADGTYTLVDLPMLPEGAKVTK